MSSCWVTSPISALQGTVGGVEEADDVVAARVFAAFGGELLRRNVVGYEDEKRVAEPLLVAEAGEETAESHVVVGDSLVDAGVTLGQRRGIAFGNHERVVGREGEKGGEERLCDRPQFFACELEEFFVPDAPVAVEVVRAVGLFVVFAADQPFDPGRAGVGPEAHRTAFRTAEEEGGIALLREDGG